jgi:hypothetical protein
LKLNVKRLDAPDVDCFGAIAAIGLYRSISVHFGDGERSSRWSGHFGLAATLICI